jgi:hypothetical protein
LAGQKQQCGVFAFQDRQMGDQLVDVSVGKVSWR